jgi:hypothetical protein
VSRRVSAVHLPELEAEAMRLVSELGPGKACEKVQEDILEADKQQNFKVRRYKSKVLQIIQAKCDLNQSKKKPLG